MVPQPHYLAPPSHAMLKENDVLQDKTSSSRSVRFPNFFLPMKRDRFPLSIWKSFATKSLLILWKLFASSRCSPASFMNLPTLASHGVITTSKVLQTDTAYLPESLVRFLLIVQLEMLSIWPLGSPVVLNYLDSTATNFIGLHPNTTCPSDSDNTTTLYPNVLRLLPGKWTLFWYATDLFPMHGTSDTGPSDESPS